MKKKVVIKGWVGASVDIERLFFWDESDPILKSKFIYLDRNNDFYEKKIKITLEEIK